MPRGLLDRARATDPLAGSAQTERGTRPLPLALAWVAAGALVAMSAFHLWTGTQGVFTAMIQRSLHLAFALGLAILLFPAQWAEMLAAIARFGVRLTCAIVWPLRHTRDAGVAAVNGVLERWVAVRRGRGWWWAIGMLEAVALVLAVGAALYVAAFHEELARRAGAHTTLDLVVAAVAIVLIIEATRRSISPPLALIATAFLVFAIFGHHLPGQWGHSPLSMQRILTQQYYTTQAIFSVPLAVSSTFVFMFVLFGAALERSGAGRYLIDLAFATMGRFRGGPAKAAVVASGFMGTLSGSSIANTVTTGSLTIPLMQKVGFSRPVSGAVEVAASTNGQLMPPVMGAAAFIMAEVTGIPYVTIIVAALLPALLSYTVIFTMVHLEALRRNIRASPGDEVPDAMRTIWRGIHLNIPFIALLVLLLGLPTGLTGPLGFELTRQTPSTAATSAIWVTLALFFVVSMMAPTTAYGLHRLAESMKRRGDEPRPSGSGPGAHRRTALSWSRVARHVRLRGAHFATQSLAALRDGAMNMVGIACACACCGIIIGVVDQTGMSFKIINVIQELAESVGGAFTAVVQFAQSAITWLADLLPLGQAAIDWLERQFSALHGQQSTVVLLAALVLTAMACIVLGIGLPTTATYIIMAALTAPAIQFIAIDQGMVETTALVLAIHLFVFYYGILADDTPPVGLCAYAAAGIAGADPIRTGINSFRLDLAAFLLPFVFFFNHELLLQDVTFLEVLWVLPGAIIGMVCFAMALQGYALGALTWWRRVLLVAAAFLLVKPTLAGSAIGMALALGVVGSAWLTARADAKADGAVATMVDSPVREQQESTKPQKQETDH